MVAAGSLVAPNTTVPTGEIWAGNPAKKLRDLDAEEAEFIMQSAVNYSALARIHAAENAKTPEEIQVLSSTHLDRMHATLHAVVAGRDIFAMPVVKSACSVIPYRLLMSLQIDKDAREDRLERDPDYDSHLGIERDPVTREITHVAAST